MKYFTIEEAEKCVPIVERLVKKGQRLRDRIAWLLEANDVVLEVSNDDGFHYFVTEQVHVNKQFHKLYYQFYKVLEELGDLGVCVVDIDDGLIDFPFKLNGRDVFLCWQPGESSIRFWREYDADERKPLVNVDDFLKEKDL